MLGVKSSSYVTFVLKKLQGQVWRTDDANENVCKFASFYSIDCERCRRQFENLAVDGAMSSVACGRNEGDTGHVDSVYWSGIARWSTTS